MQNDRLLYKLLLSTIVVLMIVAAALPAMMQDSTGTGTVQPIIPNNMFEINGVLESINNQEVIVDGVTVDIRLADLNTRLTLGDVINIQGTLEDGIFTALEVGPAPPVPTETAPNNGVNTNDDDNFEFRGVIESVDDGFVVVSGQQVVLTNTEIETSIQVGQLVKVEGTVVEGIFTAREIERPNDDGFFDDDLREGSFGQRIIGEGSMNEVAPGECIISAPDGWVSYTIRPGDAISSIAAGSGSSVAELIRVNCLENPRFIVAGRTLFVPRTPSVIRRGGNESSSSISRNNRGGSNESSGSNSRNAPPPPPRNRGGGNESSGSRSSSGSNSGSNSNS